MSAEQAPGVSVANKEVAVNFAKQLNGRDHREN